MKNVDYNELLYNKVSQELKDFISELKSKTAEAVIEYAYELTIKEDIVCVFECIDFTQEEAKSLYKEQYPLDSCYQEWLHNDQSYMDIITQTVQDKIKSSVNKRRKNEYQNIIR